MHLDLGPVRNYPSASLTVKGLNIRQKPLNFVADKISQMLIIWPFLKILVRHDLCLNIGSDVSGFLFLQPIIQNITEILPY